MSEYDFFDPQGRRRLGGYGYNGYGPKQEITDLQYELVEVWELSHSPQSKENDINKNIYPARQGYNKNDVRGGFNDKAESLVYHPDHYDPDAASLLLLNMAGTLVPVGRLIEGAIVIVRVATPFLKTERVLFGNANRALWTGETLTQPGMFMEKAGQFANTLGYHTLEQTPMGTLTYWTTSGMKVLRINPTPLWANISTKYTLGAGDIIPAIINAKTGITEGGIFMRRELPTALEKGSKINFYAIW